MSGYSPLFPTAILGRFLMTKVKAISQEEVAPRPLLSPFLSALLCPPLALGCCARVVL